MPFGTSAIGGLLAQMEEEKRRLQQPLTPSPDAFQLPQQGANVPPPSAPPPAPPLAPRPDPFANIANANVSDLNDPTHAHRKGVVGGLLHLLGSDRVQPELAALLTPDQQQRVKPGLVTSLFGLLGGVTPSTIQTARAKQIVNLQDAAETRRNEAALRTARANIAARYAEMPTDPVERYKALVAMTSELAAIGHPDATKYANILNAIKPDAPKEFAPQAVTWSVRAGMLNGKPLSYKFSNTGEAQYLTGEPIQPEVLAQIQPIPPQPQYGAGTVLPGANGLPPQLVVTSGPRMGETMAVPDVTKSAGGSGLGQAATNRLVAENEKQVTVINNALDELKKYPQGVGIRRAVGKLPFMGSVADDINQRADPKGIKLRALIANISSLKIKDRSGAAVTISEFPRLTPFIPQVSDTPEAAKVKLEQLRAEIEAHNRSLREETGGGAIKVPSFEEWKAGRKP